MTRAMVFCDDTAHPAQLTRDGIGGLGEVGVELEWIEDPRGWSAARLAAADLIILSKANNTSASDKRPWADDEVGDAFTEFVEQGKAALFLHSGTALYDDVPSLCRLMGGIFAGHPAPCPVTVQPSAGHPLSTGSKAFTLEDEHYQMAMSDPSVEVFAHSVSKHGSQPAGWTRDAGAGRVCVLTPGHFPAVWQHQSYQRLLRNCIDWCLQR